MRDLFLSLTVFVAWGIVGFVESFALLYFFVAAPLFVAIGWAAYRHLPRIAGSRLPEGFGAVAGFGAFWLFVASTIDGDASSMIAVGIAALALSVAGYLTLGHRRCHQLAAS